MTLQLAIEQIQRPSWWSANDPQKDEYERFGKAAGQVKKNTILAHIRSMRRANAESLVKTTGYTVQSIRYHTGVLIEEGAIQRVNRSDNLVFWEVA